MGKDAVVLLQAYVKTKNLLDGSYNWKGLKKELELAQEGTIDLMKLLHEYLQCINEIYINTLHVHLERILECRKYLDNLCSTHEIDKDSHPVVFKGPIPPSKSLPRETEFIPLYLLNQMQFEWTSELDFSINHH